MYLYTFDQRRARALYDAISLNRIIGATQTFLIELHTTLSVFPRRTYPYVQYYYCLFFHFVLQRVIRLFSVGSARTLL